MALAPVVGQLHGRGAADVFYHHVRHVLVRHAESRAVGRGRFALVGLGTVVAAVLANALVYAIGGVLVAYDPRFLPLANVSGAGICTLVPAIVAVPLYAALSRFARRPARAFAIVAAVVFSDP